MPQTSHVINLIHIIIIHSWTVRTEPYLGLSEYSINAICYYYQNGECPGLLSLLGEEGSRNIDLCIPHKRDTIGYIGDCPALVVSGNSPLLPLA